MLFCWLLPPPPLLPKQCVVNDDAAVASLLSKLVVAAPPAPAPDDIELDDADAVAPAEEHKFIIFPSVAVGGDNLLPKIACFRLEIFCEKLRIFLCVNACLFQRILVSC